MRIEKNLATKVCLLAVTLPICGCASVPQWRVDFDRIEFECKQEVAPLGANPLNRTDPFHQWDYDRCVETRYAIFVQEGRAESMAPAYREHMHAWYADWQDQTLHWYLTTSQPGGGDHISPARAQAERMRYLLWLQRERQRRRRLGPLMGDF